MLLGKERKDSNNVWSNFIRFVTFLWINVQRCSAITTLLKKNWSFLAKIPLLSWPLDDWHELATPAVKVWS